jgi:hypothetical protein
LSTTSSTPESDERLFFGPFGENNSPSLLALASNERASRGGGRELHSSDLFGTTPSPASLPTNTTAPAIPQIDRDNDVNFTVAIGNQSADVQNQQINIGSDEPNFGVWDDWIVDIWDDDSINFTSPNDNSDGPEDPPRNLIGVRDLWQLNNPATRSQDIMATINPLWLNELQLQEKTQEGENGEGTALPWWSFTTGAAIAAGFGVVTMDDEERRKRRQPVNSSDPQVRVLFKS